MIHKNMMKLSSKISLFYLSNRQFSTTFKFKQNMQNSSVDPNEVKYFNTMGSIWWEKEGLFKALHTLNNLRVPFIQQTLEENGILKPAFINTSTPFKDLNILDSGCGGGILSEALSLLGANVTGIDIASNLIECAKVHAKENHELKGKITYICCPLENISHQYKEKFDVVISSEILDHVGSKEVYLKSLIDVLKPKGSLILSTINQTLRAWYIYVVYGEYISRRIPIGGHHWKKLVRPEVVTSFLAENNCEILKMRGFSSCVGYTTTFEEWQWSDDLNVHYIIHAKKKINDMNVQYFL